MKSAKYKTAVQWILVLAIFIFLGRTVCENWLLLKGAPFTFKPFLLLSSTIIFIISYFFQIWAWYLITVKLHIAISRRETMQSWFYSQLGKYLPGKFWVLLGRFYLYQSRGRSKKDISVALYLETATLILAAAMFSLVPGFYLIKEDPYYLKMGFLSLPPLLAIAFLSVHPRILQVLLSSILKLFKKEPLSLSISYLDVLWILCICILSWGTAGIGFYLFVNSVFPVPWEYILFLAGALALSSTLGLVALFAPGGLGVREGVLVYILSYVLPTPVAVIISILTRIWMTLIEIGLIGSVYLSAGFHRGAVTNLKEIEK